MKINLHNKLDFIKPAYIPEAYQHMFELEQIRWIKRSVHIQSILIIFMYLFVTPLNFILDPDEFRFGEIPWGLLLMAGAYAVLNLNKKTATVFTTKANAFLFILLLLAVVTKTGLLYEEYRVYAFMIYVLTLFTLALVIPWSPSEAFLVAALHFISYGIFYLKSLDLPPVLSAKEYIDGLIVLIVSTCICMVVRLKETKRNIDNFILRKEVENQNERMKRDLKLARQIHKTLIPIPLSTRYVDISSRFLPIHFVGGDYAQFIFVGRKRLLFIVSDVTGHGVASALLVNRFHAEFETLAQEAPEPGILMQKLNTFIRRDFAGTYMFLSAFCGTIDFATGIMRYSNYGHPPQLLYKKDKDAVIEMPAHTSFLGLPFECSQTFQDELSIQESDRLLLFTDGVLDTRDIFGEEYGPDRLKNYLKRNHILPTTDFDISLIEELREYKSGPFRDDIFLADLKIKEIEYAPSEG